MSDLAKKIIRAMNEEIAIRFSDLDYEMVPATERAIEKIIDREVFAINVCPHCWAKLHPTHINKGHHDECVAVKGCGDEAGNATNKR